MSRPSSKNSGPTKASTKDASTSVANAPSKDRLDAVNKAMEMIQRQYGKGSVMRLGDKPQEKIKSYSTGSLRLDDALGIGGYAEGRIVEIYGPESSGKTTLTLHAIASVQKAGGIAAFIDAEHALDPEYARALGVDLGQLIVTQPDTGEQALEIAEQLVRSGGVNLVVIDSVAALTPRAEIEGDMGDQLPGLQARLMSQGLRKLVAIVKQTNTTVIFINQLRMKIGIMMPGQSPETTTGGNALKFYASQRLDIRRIGAVKKGEEIIGNEVKIKVVKNKLAPPFKQITTQIIFGEGISRESEIIDIGVDLKVIDKSGAWFNYGSERLGQGKENVRDLLKKNPEMCAKIESEIRQKMTGIAEEFKPDADEADEGSDD